MLRCPQCPGTDKPIYGSGPKPARVCIIGEAGGVEEVKQGKPFVGKTGQELDGQYLPLAGLDRADVYTTNCSKCPGINKQGGIDNPTNEQARACWAYFSQFELRDVQPEIIVVMGAVAVDAVIGPDIDMEMQHGLPISYGPRAPAGNWLYVPVYHPAAGLHDTKWMIALQDDFRRLRKLVRGDYSDVVIDPYPEPNYTEAQTVNHVEDYFFYADLQQESLYAAIDTEFDDGGGPVWFVTVSVLPGTGILIPADRADLLQELQFQLDLHNYVVVFHAALADLPKVQRVGITPRRWVDTMRDAYWLNEFRIGLKPLAYRYCGMAMQDFADVVNPPSKLKLHEYMQSTADRMRIAVPDSRKGKGMTDEEKLVRKTCTLVKRLIGDLEKDFAGGYASAKPLKPWDRIDDWQTQTHEVIKAFGASAITRPSIVHVERSKAVQYAVRDADAALRLRPVLQQKARELRKEVV